VYSFSVVTQAHAFPQGKSGGYCVFGVLCAPTLLHVLVHQILKFGAIGLEPFVLVLARLFRDHRHLGILLRQAVCGP